MKRKYKRNFVKIYKIWIQSLRLYHICDIIGMKIKKGK